MSDAPAAAETESAAAPPKAGIFLGGIALVVIYGLSFGVAYFVPADGAAHAASAEGEGGEHGEGAEGEGAEGGEHGEGADGHAAKSTDRSSWDRELFDVPTLVVNLANTGGKRYAKVGITIEFASAADPSRIKEKIQERLIPLRDRLITRISSETLDTVDDPERKERLRMDILATVREVCFRNLDDASVLRIYYRELIIQ